MLTFVLFSLLALAQEPPALTEPDQIAEIIAPMRDHGALVGLLIMMSDDTPPPFAVILKPEVCVQIKDVRDLWTAKDGLIESLQADLNGFKSESTLARKELEHRFKRNPQSEAVYNELGTSTELLNDSVLDLERLLLSLQSGPFHFGTPGQLQNRCYYWYNNVARDSLSATKKLDNVHAIMKTIDRHQIHGLPAWE